MTPEEAFCNIVASLPDYFEDAGEISLVYSAIEENQELRLQLGHLESIASSILHGHEQSVVDWEAFRALSDYFKD